MKIRHFACVVLVALLASSAIAQVGDNNPTGIAGQFNGNVTTGCSYDPYTANATRSITDIMIAGGVGAYPLAFTRTMNSRYTPGWTPEFGAAGSWKHSFQWSIDQVTVAKGGPGSRTLPSSYSVNYPDGRRVVFTNTGTGDTDFRGPLGVRDRFEQLANGTATECYLRLPNGGKVWFHVDITSTPSTWIYTFSAKGIIDPYNQTTTFTRPADGSLTITEPAGRTIKLFYRVITNQTEGVIGDNIVDHIVGSDGRSVQYSYTAFVTANGTRYTSLIGVAYFGDASLNAAYSYRPGNTDPNTRPLIATCTDPMFDGPMWNIAYDFAPSASGVVYGQLLREKHPNGTSVSTLTVTGATTRRETRGDNPTGAGNPTRTFTYNTYMLSTTTDFKGVGESKTYDANNYPLSVTDRNGNQTTFSSNQLNGNIKQVAYPIPDYVFPHGLQTLLNYDYGGTGCPDVNNRDQYNKYWLFATPDGNNYYRDTNKRTKRINYPDATLETFTYNSFGQVLTHTLRNGSTESYTYNSSGQVVAYWDAAHPTTGNPTIWYQYDSAGRVAQITDSRGTSNGDPNYTTASTYNSRGQLTRLTHPDGTYVQYSYNANGTLAWTADERHPGAATDASQRTSYAYDDYKRLRTVTTPLRSSGDPSARVMTYFYDQGGTGEDYTRVEAVFTKILSPGGKSVTIAYDDNLRTLRVTAVGDSNVPDAVTTYTYDPVGNRITVKDPNGQATGAVTTYNYDQMNRVFSIDDPLPVDRNSQGHTVLYWFDKNGNHIQEVRADSKTSYYSYDLMGRITSKTGYAGEVTSYTYDADGNVTQVTVPGNKVYSYGYDQLDRKTSATYPIDFSGNSRSETYQYDIANHLWKYTNPAGQTKTLSYDNRGRLTNSSWSANGPSATIGYDGARPTSISTSDGTTISFGYDEANNRTYEDQTITGLPTRRVQTDPDADGNRKNLLVKTGSTLNFANSFDYTSRNELLNIYDNNNNPFFKYSYDASGNVTQRTGQRLHDTTVMQYDALNRATLSAQNGLNGANFATSHYDYSALGNLRDTYRDEEGGKGDWFDYDPINQAITAMYSATNVTTNPTNPAKQVSYTLTKKNRTAMTVIDNLAVPPTTITTNYTNNDLSQYTVINGLTLQYDLNFNLTSYNGWTYSYDAENRLTSVSGSGHSAQFLYDGVGRCVRRTIDGATAVFTYDQWTPVAEWDGSGNLVATNVYGLADDEILYRSSGSTQFFVKSDPMGNVRFLLDAVGNGIEKYTYDAFGQPKITDWSGNVRAASSFGNRFMYSGREYLISLGLYDLRNRVYDPVMGRFYQTDPVGFEGDPTNLYRFCGHNPLLGGDPMGLFSIDIGATLDDIANFFIILGGQLANANVGSGDSSSLPPFGAEHNPLGFVDDSQVAFGGPIPWGQLATSDSFGSTAASFGSELTPIGATAARGTFNITFTKKLTSGSNVDITFTCRTCKNLYLVQYIRGGLPANMGGYTDWFVPDKKLAQSSVRGSGIVKAVDQAIKMDPFGNTSSGIPRPSQMHQDFLPFWQEMETVAICKDNGQDVVLGAWFWGHTFTGDMHHNGGGFRYNNGTWNAYLPTQSGR